MTEKENLCECEFDDIRDKPANYCYFCGKNLFMRITDSPKQENKEEETTRLVHCPFCGFEIEDNLLVIHMGFRHDELHSRKNVIIKLAELIASKEQETTGLCPLCGYSWNSPGGCVSFHSSLARDYIAREYTPISKVEAEIKKLEAENTRATAHAIDTSYIHVGINLAIDKLKELLPKPTKEGVYKEK